MFLKENSLDLNMALGKSIRVYLKEGSVTGIKLAEVVNLTIQALASPRNKLSDLNNFFSKEVNTQGVYFLFGVDDKTAKTKVYIGEAENVWERLKTHATTKDFWSEVILFTSKDENLTKSHIKYLESRLISIAKLTERYILENNNSPKLNSLPLPDRDSMEEFLLNIKILTGTLGHKFLENPISILVQNDESSEQIFNDKKDSSSKELRLFLKVKGTNAEAIQTNEGIVVLKDSEVSIKESKNYSYKTLRDNLISEGIISKKSNDKLIFIKKHLFSSPSSAAAVIVGNSINGRKTWKDQDGNNLNEIEAEDIK